MKRIVLSACLILGMTVPMATPAQAIFGLSACEKVKKQVLSLEKIEKPIIDKWNMKAGDNYSLWSVRMKQIFQQQWIELVNLEVKMYSLEMNNLKCFTNTQQIYIKKVYPAWKKEQDQNRFYPTNYNGLNIYGNYKEIFWGSIYSQ